jgi:hypothetical protein
MNDPKNYTAEEVKVIVQKALDVAAEAATKYYTEEMNSVDNWPCGFAWIKIRDIKGSSKLGKALMLAGFKKSWDRGMDIWNPSNSNVQNMDVKMAGAMAAAELLSSYGISTQAQCRMD